jgi:hypothetical protein
MSDASAADDVHPTVVAEIAPIEWSFNPWRERPRVAALAAAFALLCCLLVIGAHVSFVLTLGLCIAAAGSLSPSLTPLQCRVDGEGVARRGALGWEKRTWSEIRRGVLTAAGLLVSPFAKRNALDPYRGMFLPLPATGGAQLEQRIRPILERHGF